jgi:cellulose synthase/poly-beta-1,6-N-acetylglucosamine synthase-like glycosyltransferase
MVDVHALKALRAWLDARAGWLFLAGLGIVAAWNWRRWRRDRALAMRLRGQKPAPVRLKSTPKVSMLVAAWNEADMIREHIESFLRVRYPNKELILCAGGQDGTYEIALQYAGGQVVVLEQRAGEGKQCALQRCFERATGEMVFLTDADCLLDDESFTRTIAPLLGDSECVTTGMSRPLQGQQDRPFVIYQWCVDTYAAAKHGKYVSGIKGTNCAIRREALEAIGGFQIEAHTGTDYHLSKRLLSAGYKIRYVPNSINETEYSQTRFFRFAELRHRVRLDWRGAIFWPVFALVDFVAWAMPLVDHLMPWRRHRW